MCAAGAVGLVVPGQAFGGREGLQLGQVLGQDEGHVEEGGGLGLIAAGLQSVGSHTDLPQRVARVAGQIVQRAGTGQRVEYASVEQDACRQVLHREEGSRQPRPEDLFGHLVRQSLHRSQRLADREETGSLRTAVDAGQVVARTRQVDVGQQHGHTETACLILQRHQVVEAGTVLHEGRQVRCRMVALHPRRVVDGLREGGGVGAAEAVADEVRDLLEDGPGDGRRYAPFDGAGDELYAHRLHTHRVVDLRHEGAEVVGVGQRHAGEAVGYVEDLLLEEDDAVGVAQDGLEAGVFVGDRIPAPAPADEGVDHAALQRAGAEQGDFGDQVVEGFRLVLGDQVHLPL